MVTSHMVFGFSLDLFTVLRLVTLGCHWVIRARDPAILVAWLLS